MNPNTSQQVYAGAGMLYLGVSGVSLALGHPQMAGVFLVGVASCVLGFWLRRDRDRS